MRRSFRPQAAAMLPGLLAAAPSAGAGFRHIAVPAAPRPRATSAPEFDRAAFHRDFDKQVVAVLELNLPS